MTDECLKWHERAQDAAAKLAEFETAVENAVLKARFGKLKEEKDQC